MQKIAVNSQAFVICFQIASYLDSFNFLRILLSFIIHIACRVNIIFGNTKEYANLFPDHKRWKYIYMKYICITNYIHSFPAKRYTKSPLIAKNNWPSVKTIINPRHQLGVYLFFDSKPHLGRSKISTNQGRELQVKRTFF